MPPGASQVELGGVGWTIQDSEGSLVLVGFRTIKKKWSILLLVALTVKEWLLNYLSHCRDRSQSLIVESDSLALVNLLNGQVSGLSEAKIMADKIENLARALDNVTYK